jgi:hypothetical protein
LHVAVTVSLIVRPVVQDQLGLNRLGRQMRDDPAAVLDRDLDRVAFEEDPVFVPAA